MLFELFNFVADSNQTITVRIADNVEHVIDHNFIIIKGIEKVIFEPYDSNGNVHQYGKSFALNLS